MVFVLYLFFCCCSYLMSLKIVQEGLTENPLSVPMSASSLNPEKQSFIEGGGRGYIGCFFIYTIHVSRLYLQPLSLRVVGRENRAKC